jgi:hypothetical protein
MYRRHGAPQLPSWGQVGIEPEIFGRFVAEWLEVESIPKEAAAMYADDVHQMRDYGRQYEGKEGWD